MVDSNSNRLRSCKEEDLFCWKLSDLVNHFKLNLTLGKDQAQICSLFDITGVEHEGDCWYGQISALTKGKGKRKIDYTATKRQKIRKASWWDKHTK